MLSAVCYALFLLVTNVLPAFAINAGIALNFCVFNSVPFALIPIFSGSGTANTGLYVGLFNSSSFVAQVSRKEKGNVVFFLTMRHLGSCESDCVGCSFSCKSRSCLGYCAWTSFWVFGSLGEHAFLFWFTGVSILVPRLSCFFQMLMPKLKLSCHEKLQMRHRNFEFCCCCFFVLFCFVLFCFVLFCFVLFVLFVLFVCLFFFCLFVCFCLKTLSRYIAVGGASSSSGSEETDDQLSMSDDGEASNNDLK